MRDDDILARLVPIFREELDDQRLDLSMGTSQKDLAGWDSLAQVRLVAAIESEFGFQFSIDEIESISSARGFVEGIRKRSA
jgi:acyl carrier protein